MRLIAIVVTVFMFSSSQLSVATTLNSFSQEQQDFLAAATKIWQSLDPQQGNIQLPNQIATLAVPEQFYYLNPEDAQKILVDLWGNPPGHTNLGMILPSTKTPIDETAWGAIIQYQADGHVSDTNINGINIQKMLSDIQNITTQNNTARIKAGYAAVEIIDWAIPPHYDPSSHKLHWAKELKFGDQGAHTINYAIRILGKKGILMLNFVGTMAQQKDIEANLTTILNFTNFNQGLRYKDFDSVTDSTAPYGITTLITGKRLLPNRLFDTTLNIVIQYGWILLVIGLSLYLGKRYQRREKPELTYKGRGIY